MTERNDHELLSKAQVIREYGFPKAQLDADIKAGNIAYFQAGYDFDLGDGKTSFIGSRYYIVRASVEARIRELTTPRKKGAA
jgi:hypothetical protein